MRNLAISEKNAPATAHRSSGSIANQVALYDSARPRAMRSRLQVGAVIKSQSGLLLEALTSNVSLAGCFVSTPNPLPAGTQVVIELTYRGKLFSTVGHVTRSKPIKGMGVKFKISESMQLAILQEWLFMEGRSELSAE